VAHGGHCVARHDGRVLFVRHTLPGERVVAEVTGHGPRGRWLTADAVTVLSPSPDRVEPRCPWAGPGACGGCDWQHASLAAQRQLKATVVTEQLARLGGVTWPVEVTAVVAPGDGPDDGLGWRTRVRYAVDLTGRAGLRRHHSHEVVPVDRCLIAHPRVQAAGVVDRAWPGCDWVEVVAPSAQDEVVVLSGGRHDRPARSGPTVSERAGDRTFQVGAGRFWQVHPGAPDALRDAVTSFAGVRAGEHAVDLYAGAGLLADALVPQLGAGGRLDVVEGDRRAAADAEANLQGTEGPVVHVHAVPVERFVTRGPLRRCDLVVLDPPRTGARHAVVDAVAAWQPSRVVYVACDPAALARDVARFATHGYRLTGLQALDLFPMTHHVECVALLARG
jgi:tRNA/tmRNA/rRNA uracil-C5-methylase (TrmA/RlmC/RlmD family)